MKTSLYIHIPFCRTKCDYCDFFSVPCGGNAVPDAYMDALCREIKFRAEKGCFTGWNTVYVGGGTPSILSVRQIQRLSECVCSFDKDIREFTIELNPDDITEELLLCLKKAGITRISVGIQAMEQKVLEFVKRRSSLESVNNALDVIKKNWNGSFSADVICALPEQDSKSFVGGLEKLLLYKPDNISMYSLTVEEETPLYKRISGGLVPYDFDKADEMWLSGRDFLEKNNYFQYEVSNFYRMDEGSPCMHNLTYWELRDYVGAGSGASGSFYGGNLLKSFRYTNTKNIEEYISFWNSKELKHTCIPQEIELLDKKTESFEFFMMGLRTVKGVSLEDYRARFGTDFPPLVYERISVWKKNRLMEERTEGGKTFFSLSHDGILFLNKFLEEIIV